MKNLIMICSLVLVTQVASAGSFIEPYIGYQTGDFEFSNGTSVDSKATTLGLRAGYQMVIPWIALDVKLAKGSLEDTTPDVDYSFTDIGVTVGASIPFVRPFIGYIPAAKTTLEGGGATDEYKGTGLKLGLGIKILPLIDINIEQVSYEFDEIDGVDLATKAKHKTTMIGVGMTF